ncbi:uncharacterized protein [Amphiura filiformis]|uniref:uncharacterized protein n=1 Tax=Amphiura filiformis TaxID=82378 RepID=UPI003B21E1CC
MDLRSDTIERSDFEYQEMLGEGGCGVVYRATFKTKYKDHKEAAAKVLTHLRREEIDILRRLRHDNVVNMLGFYADGPTKVIFFEYTPYGSLYQYLSQDELTPLPNELRRRWAKEAALAIQYLHNKKILHRDVKSSNCLLFYGIPGTLKLCDFGLAKDVDHSQTTSTQQGTYRFWAPEVIRTDDRDHAVFSKYTDVWAYGMLVFEICSRKLPFVDKEWQTVINYVGKGELFPTIPADCPEELSYIMKRCWRTNPKERPSINRIVTDLHNASEFTEQWRMVNTFKPQDKNGRKLKANRVACCSNGDIVVADNFEHHHRYIVTKEGMYKMALTPPRPYQINYIGSIAINADGYIALTDWTTPFATIFSRDGKFVNRFQAASSTDNNLTGIAVDKDGNLIVHDSQRTVTQYSCPDGRQLNQIQVDGNTQELPRIATNSHHQLLFYDDSTSTGITKVIAVNNEGKEVFNISPQIGERATGKTYRGMEVGLCGLVTGGENDEIFIAMKVCIPNIDKYSGRIGRPNTGHVHRYSCTGEFQQCIIRGLHSPHDLAMTSDGSLIVANDDGILKYSVEPALVVSKTMWKPKASPDRTGKDRVA